MSDDVETARLLIAEHVADPADPGYCGSATHVYPVEWACYRRSWAELVLMADARGEIEPGDEEPTELREPA
ncbi:hypothetical protein [Cryptosporangium sp. NPDC051539]|uniref:hypothetical protein n=1 Tax=Cryptosporangium sp. NPDC051539 TaxID=3363962 RepID=UPI0037AE5782